MCGDILRRPATDVVKTIKNINVLKALFYQLRAKKKFKERVVLKLPVTSRRGSSLFCLESILANKYVLQKLTVSEEPAISVALRKRLLITHCILDACGENDKNNGSNYSTNV